MSITNLIASAFNLGGPDGLIILLILLIFAAPVIGVFVLVRHLNRRSSILPTPPPPTATSTAERLEQLDQLKQRNLLSDAEYEEQRRRIVSGI